MKKRLLIAAIAVFGITSVNAQEVSFGLTAGFAGIESQYEGENITISTNDWGFYAGAFVDLGLTEKIHIQPSINYAIVQMKDDGGIIDKTSFIYLPIMIRYYITDSGFNIQAGPQLNYFMPDAPDYYSKLGFDVAFGVGYDATENIFVEARYALGLNNRVADAPDESTLKYNNFLVGVGYKF